MSVYTASPFAKVPSLVEGKPAYSAGSFNSGISPGKFYITSYAVATNVATIGVKMQAGNVPAVGDKITVRGVPVAALNVAAVALTAVVIDAATGIGTLSYAATSPNVGTTSSGGQAIVAVPEVAEALVQQAYKAFAVPFNSPEEVSGRTYAWTFTFPSLPTTATMELQGAINNIDSEYTAIDSAAETETGKTQYSNVPTNVRFVRLAATAVAGGTNPTVVGKILT